ncbi:MAG: hypothetical protein HY591_01405 [Candidatus Omnitrophica bacterium]|nr:hypothetical protein [Candidatus Omnitrophota bacterium]
MTPIILSLIYLFYLSLICQTLFIYDSIGYIKLGERILHQGIIAYIQDGPQREPLYPLIIAAAMRLGQIFSVDYNWILKLLHIAILALTQVLAFIILKGLGVKGWPRTLAILYIGISPVLVNSTLWVYSEIAVMPLVLAVVLSAARAWKGPNAVNGIVLGLCLFLCVCAKNIFEAIAPLLMLPFLVLAIRKKWDRRVVVLFLTCSAAFYIPLTSYKFLNYTLNGHFTFTDRASWALYGNTARRMEPLTSKRLAAAFAYIPSPHLCYVLLDRDHCDFWSYKPSDNYGAGKFQELQNNGTPKEKIDRIMINLAVRKTMDHPFQYTFLAFLESLKMLFWETSKAGQVTYPDWLEKTYNLKWFDPLLVSITAGLSLCALVSLIILLYRGRNKTTAAGPYAQGLALFTLLMLMAYAACHSFFFVLQRYALPIAPLWIVAIAFMFNKGKR